MPAHRAIRGLPAPLQGAKLPCTQIAIAQHKMKLVLFADVRINSRLGAFTVRGKGVQVIALIQRVSEAGVTVEGEVIGRIGRGLVALVAVQPHDTERQVSRLVERVLTYRVFPDGDGRMNQSLLDQGLALLAVPQFTLAADTRKGARPSFTGAASPDQGRECFDLFLQQCRDRLHAVACGRFGANMQVSLINDGPTTFWLES